MAEIVNLRRVRKQRERTAKSGAAAQNRAIHGRTRAEQAHMDEVAAQRDRVLEGAWLDLSGRDGEPDE